jgi:two-component system, OmpR family, sensor histidine kinase KdpD
MQGHPSFVARRVLPVFASQRASRLLFGLVASAAAVAAVTAVVYVLRSSVPVLSLGVLYLFAVLPIAVVWGSAFSVPVALASILAFNFFFLPPVHTFTLLDERDWLALAVYLATAIVVSELASRARRRTAEAKQREREETLLAELSIALLQGEDSDDQLERVSAAAARVLRVGGAHLELGPPRLPPLNRQPLELRAGERTVGTIYVDGDAEIDQAVSRRFLPTLASLLAVALDREQLQREALAAERLRLSDSVKTAILRAVSHDLRSPLTAIRVAAESLASPSVTLNEEDKLRQLETVRHESARLDRLVANLLDLSRLEAHNTVSQPELVEVDELVGQALSALGGEQRVRVDSPGEPVLVEVDAVQVERVLVNLLENALRYSPAQADVVVRVAAADEEVVVRVVDEGPGIPEAELDRIFEPFQRLAAADAGRGTGLGLAIARGFAEANGGRVWAERTAGEGGSFAVAFPRAAVPVGAAP